MSKKTKIVFHAGGPAFHPVADQIKSITSWLGDGLQYASYDGVDAFEYLDGCDLLVLMGLHWTGMSADWAGKLVYRPMQERHKSAYEDYIASGKPLLIHHGAIAGYADWPRFGELAGFTWVWGKTSHSAFGTHTVHVLHTDHPVVAGVKDYTLADELYYDVQITPGFNPAVHAEAAWEGRRVPMIFTGSGGRTSGAGRAVYLANGHDMKAFECSAMKTLWINAVNWLLKT